MVKHDSGALLLARTQENGGAGEFLDELTLAVFLAQADPRSRVHVAMRAIDHHVVYCIRHFAIVNGFLQQGSGTPYETNALADYKACRPDGMLVLRRHEQALEFLRSHNKLKVLCVYPLDEGPRCVRCTPPVMPGITKGV
jgi:hypothetical protein